MSTRMYASSMRVLVAPDKFRGTLSAEQAARAIETGWLRARPTDELEIVPMADGGEGTLEALVAALDGELVPARVAGPLGDHVDAAYGTAGDTAVVEMARASGLALVSESRRDALRATTRGTGELVSEALERHRPAKLIVCIGGSATTDGGAGMAQALGARLLDAEGKDILPGGIGLLDLATIDATGVARVAGTARVLVACDVDNPLVGPSGAAHVYGPQKGARPDEVLLLDRALAHYAAVLYRDLGLDLRDLPGAGAAGGLGAGLVAFLGAKLRPGIEVVMDAVGLRERLEGSQRVVTGEGKLDDQSLRGKTVAGVMRAAEALRVPVTVLCGRAELQPEGVDVASLVGRFGEERALGDTRRALEDLSEEVAAGVGLA